MSSLQKIFPVLIPIVFYASFALLYTVNPMALTVLDDFGLTCYNINGMEARGVVVSGYVIVGLLAVLSCYYVSHSRYFKAGLVAVCLLALSNLIWISFGLVPFVGDSRAAIVGLIARNFIAIVSGAVGLLILGGVDFKYLPNRTFGLITIIFGLLILALLFCFFIADKYKWMPINFAFVVYFSWYAIFGLFEFGFSGAKKEMKAAS